MQLDPPFLGLCLDAGRRVPRFRSIPAAGEEPRRTPADLRLVWVDLCGIGPSTIRGTTRELQVLFDPLVIRLAAETSVPGTDGEAGGVRVVLMRSNPNRARRHAPVGGAVLLEPGRQLTVWIFPTEVAGALGLAFERRPLWDAPAESGSSAPSRSSWHTSSRTPSRAQATPAQA